MVAGFQVPIKLLSEFIGNNSGVAPLQYEVVKLNVGAIFESTTMVNVAVVGQPCPAVGVKVYVVVCVLFKAGLQVPVIEGVLVEFVGNGVKALPAQMEETASNVGVTIGFRVTVAVKFTGFKVQVPFETDEMVMV
jgi:transcription antitermination factor NusG